MQFKIEALVDIFRKKASTVCKKDNAVALQEIYSAHGGECSSKTALTL